MTVLAPKVKKSSHREKCDRNRAVPNTGQTNASEAAKSASISRTGDLKKSHAHASGSRSTTECKKLIKKQLSDKPSSSNKSFISKPGCSGLNSAKPSSSFPIGYNIHKVDEENETCNSDDEYGSGFLNDELESRFAQRLYEVRGLRIQEVKGDGACMFRAVAAQVYGDEEKHLDVRLNCIEYIARNREHFSQFITEDFDAYLTRKRQPEVHGNHVELQAISEIYGRQIEIYEYDTKPVITFHPITVEANVVGEHPPLMLSYHGNVHYNCVVDPYHPVNTPINPIIFTNLNTNMHERISYKNAVNASEVTHIEEQMLNDKLKMTDYEGTDNDLTQQIAKESYMEYIRSLERKEEKKCKPKEEVKPENRKEQRKHVTPTASHVLKDPKNNLCRASSNIVKRTGTSTASKRGSSFPDLSLDQPEDFAEPKIKRIGSSTSLPNISSEFGRSLYHNQTSLLKPDSLPLPCTSQQPTCTKTLLNKTAEKIELNEKTDTKSPTSVEVQTAVDKIPTPTKSATSLYEELLASTVFDDDDESQSLAQALALSQQDFFNSLN